MGEAKRREEERKKTAEEALAEKKKQFEENPDMFVNLNDLLMGAVREKGPNGQEGISYMFHPGAPHTLLKSVFFDLDINFKRMIFQAQAEARQKQQGRIITPGNSGNGEQKGFFRRFAK